MLTFFFVKYISGFLCCFRQHTGLSGKVLDKDFLTFQTICTDNFQKYLTETARSANPRNQVKLTPIFTTELEREKFYNIKIQTKDKISKIIKK
jgi:hypothetical protein